MPPASSPEILIECREVRKIFRSFRRRPGLSGIFRNFLRREPVEFRALDGIRFAIRRGEFVGLIGANGAGKTTLVKCLTGIIPVTSGQALLFGRDSFRLTDAHKKRLALVMGQRSQLFWDIPAWDSFRLLRTVYEIRAERFEERARGYAERLGVADRLDVQLRHLSLGQRMKMEIIGAFLHDPDVVFLDEPTIGLDLVSQETIRQFLRELNREHGVTIVLTSHDMADIEQTCERLLILDEGALLFDGDLVTLQERLLGRRAVELHLEPGSRGWSPGMERELEPFGARLAGEGPLLLRFEVPVGRSQALIQHLFDLFQVRDLNVERPLLEDLVREIFRSGEIGGGEGSGG